MSKSAFDFEGGAEYGEFYDLGADLVQEDATTAEKNAAFNSLWGTKYRGQRDWEGKKYTDRDRAKARKALNAGWREYKGGLGEPAGEAISWGPIAMFLGGMIVVWFIVRPKEQ